MHRDNLLTFITLLMILVSCSCKNQSPKSCPVESADTSSQSDICVVITHNSGLTIYDVPESSIYLLTGSHSPADYTVFVCTAAFTDVRGRVCGHYLDLDGSYVCNPKDKNITGGFIVDRFISGGQPYCRWSFFMDGYESELKKGVLDERISAAFAQNMIIYRGIVQDMSWRFHRGQYDIFKYRALCEIDQNLLIIESQNEMPYNEFVERLSGLDVYQAIYLDMGTYNYLWCRETYDNEPDKANIITESGINAHKISNKICFQIHAPE